MKDAAGKRVTLEEYKGKNVILVFYLGSECPHCMRQFHDIGDKKNEWERLNTVVLAVSSTPPEKNSQGLKAFGDLPVRLLSDDHYANARRFHSYDDFEEAELHSTILIDREGRVRLGAQRRRSLQRYGLPGETGRAHEYSSCATPTRRVASNSRKPLKITLQPCQPNHI